MPRHWLQGPSKVRASIVIPTNREPQIQEFLAAWRKQFDGHRVIVVEDNPERTFKLPEWVTHVSWKEIDEDLGDEAWIIPRRTGAIRNYGIMLAGRSHPDMTVMLDDDCLPGEEEFFLERHWTALQSPGVVEPFFDTLHPFQQFAAASGVRARGYPKHLTAARTVLNHGLWNNIPDLDGVTQKANQWLRTTFPSHSIQVPTGVLFPLSAMNVAFRPEILPAMYQMPMGEGQPYHRFDDIWCGWIVKRACDHLGLSVRSGAPFVDHVRASNAERNAEIEALGIIENERVLANILNMRLMFMGSLKGVLEEIHEYLSPDPYWARVHEAAAIWRSLATS